MQEKNKLLNVKGWTWARNKQRDSPAVRIIQHRVIGDIIEVNDGSICFLLQGNRQRGTRQGDQHNFSLKFLMLPRTKAKA